MQVHIKTKVCSMRVLIYFSSYLLLYKTRLCVCVQSSGKCTVYIHKYNCLIIDFLEHLLLVRYIQITMKSVKHTIHLNTSYDVL